MNNQQTDQPRQQGNAITADSLTPQERKLHDGIMDNAANTFGMAAQHFQKSDNPVAAVGQAAGNLFHTMLLSANKSGKAIPKRVSQVALKSLVEDMMEIAYGIGALPVKSQEEAKKASGIAFKAAVDTYVKAEQALRKSKGAQQPAVQPPAAPTMPAGPADMLGGQPGGMPGGGMLGGMTNA